MSFFVICRGDVHIDPFKIYYKIKYEKFIGNPFNIGGRALGRHEKDKQKQLKLT